MPGVDAERAYLEELTRRLETALGQELISVYAGGSYALGGYEPGRSDLDVAAIVRSRLAPSVAQRIIAAVRHEALPCPARKLELVVYTIEGAASGSVDASFELNLNTGPDEFRADVEPQPGEGHWFAIDRSVLAANGIALVGPVAGEVFSSPERDELRPVLAEALRWYRRNEPEGEDGLLNAGRALRFAREGVWTSKPAMRAWAREQHGATSELLERAIAELEAA